MRPLYSDDNGSQSRASVMTNRDPETPSVAAMTKLQTEARNNGSIADGGADHLHDSADPVVAAERAVVERRARDRLPPVARAVVFEILRDAGQLFLVLAVAAAHLVDRQIEGRHDVETEASRAGLPIRVLRRAGHVAVGVHLELQREHAVGIECRRLADQVHVLLGNQLPFTPAAAALSQMAVQ